MANITAYPVGTPKGTDLVVGTQVADPNTDGDTNKTRNFTVKQIAEFANIPSAYTAYTALISQNGVTDPTATVIYNNTSSLFTWARTGAGAQTVTSSVNLNFTGGKTIVFVNYGNPGSDGLPPKWTITSDTIITVTTQDETGVLDDDILTSGAFEIRIYN